MPSSFIRENRWYFFCKGKLSEWTGRVSLWNKRASFYSNEHEPDGNPDARKLK